MATETRTPVKGVAKAAAKSEVVPARAEKAAVSRPLSAFEEMERLMESMVGDIFPRGWMRPMPWEWPLAREFGAMERMAPKVDVIERDDEVVVRAEIPGVEKKDLDVSLTQNAITIKGETSREEKEHEKGRYFRSEISRGAFARTVSLPAEVDTEKAKASFKDGVLELTVPKVQKSMRRSVPLD